MEERGTVPGSGRKWMSVGSDKETSKSHERHPGPSSSWDPLAPLGSRGLAWSMLSLGAVQGAWCDCNSNQSGWSHFRPAPNQGRRRGMKYSDLFLLLTSHSPASTSHWLNPMEARGQRAHMLPPTGSKLPAHRTRRKGARRGSRGCGSEVQFSCYGA